MEELYGWVRNLAGYFIFLSVLDNLIPSKSYGRYIRLFAGMVLILLVVRPLTGSLGLEDRIAGFYEGLVFRYQADGLKQDILGIERQRREQMIDQYEQAVAEDVERMAREEGFTVLGSRAAISREEGTERFGTVTGIWLQVRGEGPEGEKEGKTGKGEGEEEVGEGERKVEGKFGEEEGKTAVSSSVSVAIPPVEIAVETGKSTEAANKAQEAVGEISRTDGGTSKADGRTQEAAGGTPKDAGDEGVGRQREQQWEGQQWERQQWKEQQREEQNRLRKRISAYYNLEESYVEIQVVEREG